MRSTGEKKCRPIKSCGREKLFARPVIGRVEVLEANTGRPGMAASVLRVTSSLISRL